MSYGHFSHKYYGHTITFPKESFLISGISFYKENCINITYDTELIMKYEPHNKYDASAIFISILSNNNIVGYVPNTSTEIKELCKNNIDEILKIINIKITNGNYGIRVIPKCFYEYDPTFEKSVIF